MKFAVVDLETTGGTPENGRITEVGIVLLDDFEVVRTYQTLLDPGMPIQPFVVKLTGITDEMVSGQPQFNDVAEEIAEMIKGRIFVAHNVQFDCRFLRSELRRACVKMDPPRLCTVKLSRKFFPGLPSYSLHNLIESLELPDFHHHRALDDAMAAAEILKLCLQKAGPEKIRKEIKNITKAEAETMFK
ncbi:MULTISPECIES: PolC-type DNA polymerase III [unclassified Fibrobacter]|uniref:3'-5' exonuclease n=1 Tax=unclassified Fibrobacter TaxID=2634177 RepID=UPI000D6D820D|nr:MULTISPECIES: 3'-5' exonuclease [unclassified Fibrobacter]PWJ63754.1 DNA polymerase-3 subunit epsilon [Fibrobacter sp. UWR4]PZW69142.1 DNA polymerase-3 subunit epsilon [Fibrobacter sp. UWR1]